MGYFHYAIILGGGVILLSVFGGGNICRLLDAKTPHRVRQLNGDSAQSDDCGSVLDVLPRFRYIVHGT